jgi:hypothetical protein
MKEQAAAEQRRHRARPRAERHDRSDRQPLNLKGPNYLLDAACSSSLLAVNAAIDELRSGPQPDDAGRRRERLAAGRR